MLCQMAQSLHLSDSRLHFNLHLLQHILNVFSIPLSLITPYDTSPLSLLPKMLSYSYAYQWGLLKVKLNCVMWKMILSRHNPSNSYIKVNVWTHTRNLHSRWETIINPFPFFLLFVIQQSNPVIITMNLRCNEWL